MADDFQPLMLGDVCTKIGSGATPRGGKEAYRGGATALIRSQNIYNDRFVHDGLVFIDDEQAEELRNVVVASDDVLLNITGDSVARCCQVDPSVLPARVNQHVAILRPRPDVLDAMFLRYSLVSPAMQARLFALASAGATRNALTKGMLEGLVVTAPCIAEQRTIAHILGTLDGKIELNRRRNETLEAMARALFQDWFVDFGPVRAKMDGREPYLPADLWKLFPNRFDGEGKPEGWEAMALGEATVELRRGVSPSYVESGGIRVLNQKCIRNREINFVPARRHDHSKRMIEGRKIFAGDILVNSTGVGTLGRVAQIWKVDEPTVVDSHVTVVRANTDVVSAYYLGLDMTGREAEIEALGEGSTGQTELSRVRLGSLPVLVPTREVLNQLDVQVRPLLGEMLSNTEESVALVQLRDTLLPKLISGELRVRDAERHARNVL
jgi:type I restriction enzyme, S subunit